MQLVISKLLSSLLDAAMHFDEEHLKILDVKNRGLNQVLKSQSFSELEHYKIDDIRMLMDYADSLLNDASGTMHQRKDVVFHLLHLPRISRPRTL